MWKELSHRLSQKEKSKMKTNKNKMNTKYIKKYYLTNNQKNASIN